MKTFLECMSTSVVDTGVALGLNESSGSETAPAFAGSSLQLSASTLPPSPIERAARTKLIDEVGQGLRELLLSSLAKLTNREQRQRWKGRTLNQLLGVKTDDFEAFFLRQSFVKFLQQHVHAHLSKDTFERITGSEIKIAEVLEELNRGHKAMEELRSAIQGQAVDAKQGK